MSVLDAKKMLRDVYERQAHMLKTLEERYTGRPIYEDPVSFDTERGEVKRSVALQAVKQGDKVVAAERVDGGAVVSMPKKDYMREHNDLIAMLSQVSRATGKEAAKQRKEIKGKGTKCVRNIKGGCGECGGSNGKIDVEKAVKGVRKMLKGGADRTPERQIRRRPVGPYNRQVEEQIEAAIESLRRQRLPDDIIFSEVLPRTFAHSHLKRYYDEHDIASHGILDEDMPSPGTPPRAPRGTPGTPARRPVTPPEDEAGRRRVGRQRLALEEEED